VIRGNPVILNIRDLVTAGDGAKLKSAMEAAAKKLF
jgi:hypothetical protein